MVAVPKQRTYPVIFLMSLIKRNSLKALALSIAGLTEFLKVNVYKKVLKSPIVTEILAMFCLQVVERKR